MVLRLMDRCGFSSGAGYPEFHADPGAHGHVRDEALNAQTPGERGQVTNTLPPRRQPGTRSRP
jgi:hypothetical protein